MAFCCYIVHFLINMFLFCIFQSVHLGVISELSVQLEFRKCLHNEFLYLFEVFDCESVKADLCEISSFYAVICKNIMAK